VSRPVALVTGASRGVGAATAVALAAAGYRVACAARSTAAQPQRTSGTLDQTVAAIEAAGGEAVAIPTNLAVVDEVEAMVRLTVDHFGGLDALVNNAAITFPGGLAVPLKRYELMMAVNLRAPLVAIQSSVPAMEAAGGGRIVNVSSAAALSPFPELMAYGMSKIALERLTVDAARQLRRQHIAVNCFRIDVPVASEGFIANMPGGAGPDWEPCEVAAEGICWMLDQPLEYSGQVESMYGLRRREGIMATKAAQPYAGPTPPSAFVTGVR
jgi:NAD(P)-dependent dehydrogenase (short-subunit alcohol dehydrogenase family)